ncbi:hypothetical protein HYT01_00005 [Candidatus Giovannonibacteria bacterium]|nr:hypothetical protein [Candidatus Giovannonibacteria bacterium]
MKRTLEIEKYFSKNNVYNSVKWEKTDVTICDEEGKKLFIQKDVESPTFWSQLARQIVASRYFYGENGTQEREYSAKQLIGRVSDTFGKWGLEKGYFNADEFSDVHAYYQAKSSGRRASLRSNAPSGSNS